MKSSYIGRFAPSPTGPLHFGSLVAAMASFLDAKAHQGQWLLRIEDIDESRVVAGSDHVIMSQLHALGMLWDGEVVWQTKRKDIYQHYFNQMRDTLYGCICTRQQLRQVKRNGWGEFPYQNICRQGLSDGVLPRVWRLAWETDMGDVTYQDRWHGEQIQHIPQEVGDMIIKRADGLFSYQWVVVIDDALQGVTDIVRGADLLSSTPRQIALQQMLGFKTPSYLHVPLVLDQHGRKLSKQNHAPPIDIANPLEALWHAFYTLGFPPAPDEQVSLDAFWDYAIAQWRNRFVVSP
ncbi:MAG: tRNA glutamyl-Q(34) synthetase GluQRS [Alcaligenaceae bacterium]|nr:tRNA glutamyl-Q(34) synthetase GluQRS [Alcaligenaceae bacterium]